MELSGCAAVLGLSRGAAPAGPGLPRVELEVVERLAPAPEPLRVVAGAPGRLMIQSYPSGGHLMSAPDVGRAVVEPGATRILAEPPQEDPWAWNRWVLGQVLPFTAGLRGRELLHAAAVLLAGRAVALVGPSGRGKSTLAAALVDAGGSFLADDVIALEARGGQILAHPGPGVLMLDPPRFLAPAGPHPLAVVGLLERGPQTAVEELDGPDPMALLGNAYERVRRDPARLAGQLSLLAELARGARFLRIQRGPDSTPAELAERVLGALGGG
jgi:hypothetical protein